MPYNLLPSSFSLYELPDNDAIQGSIYSEAQLAVLQNHLAVKAEEKINYDYDPSNPLQFAQKEAELKGAIQFIQYLIDTSKELTNPTITTPNEE